MARKLKKGGASILYVPPKTNISRRESVNLYYFEHGKAGISRSQDHAVIRYNRIVEYGTVSFDVTVLEIIVDTEIVNIAGRLISTPFDGHVVIEMDKFIKGIGYGHCCKTIYKQAVSRKGHNDYAVHKIPEIRVLATRGIYDVRLKVVRTKQQAIRPRDLYVMKDTHLKSMAGNRRITREFKINQKHPSLKTREPIRR